MTLLSSSEFNIETCPPIPTTTPSMHVPQPQSPSHLPQFPLKTLQTARKINSVHTEVLVTGFRNRILILVTQYDKIGSLLYTTLDSLSPISFLSNSNSTSGDPPTPSRTTNVLLGAYSTLYHLYASLISEMISRENPVDSRDVVVGLALWMGKEGEDEKNSKRALDLHNELFDREFFDEIQDMIRECRVW
ncbi:hypothetical protein G9A89_004299 [Geosiphon pyriformis]|nr:hypothetical protein G9A89_004299 [Geosiphon pyriformis]